jgi:hypothetical protein
MIERRLWLACFVLCAWSSACAKIAPELKAGVNSSETHFLMRCSNGCGKGLSCTCGVCSKPCTSATACAGLAGDAVCTPAPDESCSAASICDLSCSHDADCTALGKSHVCAEGRCRAPDPHATAADASICSGATCDASSGVDGGAGGRNEGSGHTADPLDAGPDCSTPPDAPRTFPDSGLCDDSEPQRGISGQPAPDGYVIYCDPQPLGTRGCDGVPNDIWGTCSLRRCPARATYPEGCSVNLPTKSMFILGGPQTCVCQADLPNGTEPHWICPL